MTKATTRTRKQYPATAPTPPAGAYAAKKGSTVFGLGRPSLADFEEHEYATRKVPDELRTVSPTELQAKARAKDRKKIGLHTSR
jgi:hypothetical protein